MSNDRIDTQSKVYADRAIIPARIWRALNIDDGDQLRWQLKADESIRVHFIQQQPDTFADFDGYDGSESIDLTSEYDALGVDIE